jgi:hypothetical protein
MTTTSSTPPLYIVWNTTDRKHMYIAEQGTLEECQRALDYLGYEDHEICANQIIDSWDNEVNGWHFDTWADGTTTRKPLTN